MGVNYGSKAVRDAATLTATTVAKTLGVECKGALQILWHLIATNANALAAVALEVSNDNATWDTLAGALTGTLTNTTSALTALNDAKPHVAHWSAGTLYPGGFPFKYARLSVTGHATLSITGLACTAETMYGAAPNASFDGALID